MNGNGLTPNESFRFWQHLANAGLIPGTYTGVAGPGSHFHHVYKENYPPSKIGSAGWFVASYSAYYPGSTSVFAGDYQHYIFIGTPIADAHPYGAILTPQELWNLDVKMDDGKPATGHVIAHAIFSCTTGTGPTDYGAEYLLTQNSLLCSTFFPHAF